MFFSIVHVLKFGFLLCLYSFIQATADLNADKLSLLAFKSSFILSNDSSFRGSDWSSNNSVCDWIGVKCGLLHRRVVELDMSNMKVGGSIPSELGNLTFLDTLILGGNSFHGELPQELARLPRLKTIDLSNNGLEGELPKNWLSNTTRLQFLYLPANNFTGEIPSSIFNMSTLEYLSLRNNMFYGTLPPDICVNGLQNLVELELQHNMMDGEIPSSLSYCSKLQSLSLSYNNFFGELPKGIGNLTLLQGLGLKVNNLSGSIPAEIGRLPNLFFIALQWNNLSGPIPAEIGELPILFSLALHENRLSGPIPPALGNISSLFSLFLGSNNLIGQIPPSLCNLSLLNHLDLAENQMEGNIPQCIVNFSVNLQILILQGNHFNGSIPDTFKENSTLLYLDVNSNRLQGTLPKSLLNCVRLQVLNIGNNVIRDTFPFWFGSLPDLRVLVLKSNRFYGDVIPPSTSKTPFMNLRILDVSHNGFNGSIPNEFMENFVGMKVKMNWTEDEDWYMFSYQSMTQLIKGVNRLVDGKIMISLYTIINLSDNQFDGSIPDSVGDFVSLNYLYLSQNRFTGQIPKSLANLRVLEALDLSSNQLTGQIPRELLRLTFLSTLNLSWNNLTGPIPTGAQFDTFEYESYMGNPGLCGKLFVLKKCREDVQPSPPIMLERDDHGFFDSFTWRAVLIGYGLGIIVGFQLVYFSIVQGRPLWFVNFYNKVTSCFELYFG